VFVIAHQARLSTGNHHNSQCNRQNETIKHSYKNERFYWFSNQNKDNCRENNKTDNDLAIVFLEIWVKSKQKKNPSISRSKHRYKCQQPKNNPQKFLNKKQFIFRKFPFLIFNKKK